MPALQGGRLSNIAQNYPASKKGGQPVRLRADEMRKAAPRARHRGRR